MTIQTYLGRLCPALICALAGLAAAQEPDVADQLKEMRQQIDQLRQQMAEKDSALDQLRREVQQLRPDAAAQRESTSKVLLDELLADIQTRKPANEGLSLGGAGQLRLLDISMNLLFAAGGSSERDASLANLQGGGHDPRKRGFTVQNAELSLMGVVDPFFNGEVHLITFVDPLEGETVVELEEAFLTTTSLPHGLQLEAGHFFTEFGRLNPTHPHAWAFMDQPVIFSRLFGPDGLRGSGVRLGWLTPLPWFSELHVGVQNAGGETMASFLANTEFFDERPVGGLAFAEQETRSSNDMVGLLRWVNGWDLSEEWSVLLGGSALMGPNATGPEGKTLIYGADLTLKWHPAHQQRGWPFFTWQSEFALRDYDVDPSNANFVTDELRDWGFYTQGLYGFRPGWAAGLRYEYATGSGDSFDPVLGSAIPRSDDPFRDDRHRISPLVIWQTSEFSRIRFQYNHDIADHLDGPAHSVWLGFEVMFGAHPAHSY